MGVILLAGLLLTVPARAEIAIAISEEIVVAGAVVEVPVQMAVVGSGAGEVVQVAGIELDLSWDPGVLFLESFSPAPDLGSWVWLENLERARGRIALASVEGIAVGATAIEIGSLRFRTSPVPGQSPVAIAPIPIRTANLESVLTMPSPGLITTIAPVPAGRSTMGELKVTYHRRE
jgi:hypothetical protein